MPFQHAPGTKDEAPPLTYSFITPEPDPSLFDEVSSEGWAKAAFAVGLLNLGALGYVIWLLTLVR